MLLLSVVLTCYVLTGSMGTVRSPNPSIVVVGSGPSGIAAATKLLKNNFTNIKILEAENRIGGRINSVEIGNAYVDLGAEFCHGEGKNIVYSMVKDLGILRPTTRESNFLLSNGEIINNQIAIKIIKFAESLEADDELKADCENVTSVGACLTIRSKTLQSAENPKEKEILARSPDWAKSYLCYLDSPFDLNDLNIVTTYKKCEGDLGLNWNGLGYKIILEIMRANLSKPEQT